jgi:ABC-type Na+ efflux pump permease subunit
MLREILFIGGQDLRQVLRARETLMWVFVMPILFFWFIGSVTGGFARPTKESPDALVLDAPDDAGFLVDELERRLTERFYRVERSDTTGAIARHVTVPAAFTDSVLAGVPTQLRYEYRDTGLGGDYERIRVGRAAYTVLADLSVVSQDSAAVVDPAAFAELAAMPRALTVDVKPAGKRQVIPTGFSQSVPGIMVMFTLLVMSTSGAVLLVIERRQGLLRRLASAPLDRRSIVLGKWAGRLVVGLVQIGFAMLAGTVLFGMDWGPDLPFVFLVMLVYAALMASIGLLLGSVARSEGQAVAVGVISANVLGALGGCWWPIEITPAWMQKLALFLPTGWAMNALHKLVAFGAGPMSIVPHVVGMSIVAALVLAATARLFRFD